MRNPVWNNISFKMMSLFAIFLVPVYVLLLFSGRSYMNSLQQQAVQSANGILELNINTMEAEVKRLNAYLYDLQNHNSQYTIIQYKEQISETDYNLAFISVNSTMVAQIANGQYADAIFVNDKEMERFLLAYSQNLASEKHNLKDTLLESGFAEENSGWKILMSNEKRYLAHTFGVYGVYAGAVISLEEYLTDIRSQIGIEDSQIVVNESESAMEKEGYVSVTNKLAYTKQYVHIYLSEEEIYQNLPILKRLSYTFSVLSIFLIPVMFFMFWLLLVKPLKKIEKGLNRLAQGEQDYRIEGLRASNEFLSLADSFNEMAGEIQTLKIESYEKKLEQKQMALQNIMLQTRPHFLLNTFNQIFSMAQFKDYEGIQKMTLYLSKYFRYLFRAGKLNRIENELGLVDEYLEMMKLRYLDCFTVVWNIDETLKDYQLPPLLLHNFVENIFKYAVDEGSETNIEISLQREENYVVLMVQDDGPGMEPDILDKIEAGEPIDKKDGMHVGIWNSNYRLKTFCGEKSKIEIKSVLAEGTTIRILLPYQEEKNG